jgi:thiol-disulfide isomerase/thioredoxin
MTISNFTPLVAALVLVTLGAGARTADAAELDLEQYRGKVVVLDFWASWCVPCRRSFPWMNRMHAKYGDDGLVIIGVNLDRDPADARAFLEEIPADFLIHYDTEATLAEAYGVEGMPSSYVIGRDGEIVAQHLGFKVKREDEYETALINALGDTP